MTIYDVHPWLAPIVKIAHYVMLYGMIFGKYIIIAILVIFLAIYIRKKNKKDQGER